MGKVWAKFTFLLLLPLQFELESRGRSPSSAFVLENVETAV